MKAPAPVAVFDLDGTITVRDTYLQFLVFFLLRQPLRFLRTPLLVFYVLVYKCGLRSNHWLKSQFLKTVAGGTSRQTLLEIAGRFVVNDAKKNVKPQALAELERLRQAGYKLVLATASFDFYVELYFEALNMDALVCTRAEFNASDELTGSIDGRNCIGEEKRVRVSALLRETGFDTVARAYSDSEVDLPLLRMAGTAVVVDPKPATRKVAGSMQYDVVSWR